MPYPLQVTRAVQSDDILTRSVFVAGGTPEVTYNPRSARHLESEVQGFLGQAGKALSVFGPTKCGKTVLIERQLPQDEAIWIQGADMTSAEDLWRRVVDFFGLWDTVEVSTGQNRGGSGGLSADVNAGIFKVGGSVGESTGSTYQQRSSRTRALADVAREALRAVETPIVIDDFHFVPDHSRQEIARAIKSIIPHCPVIMIAVPYDAFEAVMAEPDLGGRVWHLELKPWNEDELQFIASAGFEALNLVDADGRLGERCSKEAMGAPFLMQQLCYEVCTTRQILKRPALRQTIAAPDQWVSFLERLATRTRPPIFLKLLEGKKPRGTERLMRRFVEDQREFDIYGCVLRAIQKLGAKAVTTYAEINQLLTAPAVLPAPNGQQVGGALAHMSEIADGLRGTGDPAFVYKDERAYLVDPFLRFYLSRGGW